MTRPDGRENHDLRPVRVLPGFISSAPGSVLMEMGKTRVLCTATASESVPAFLAGSGKGWLTAEYAMLPASTGARKPREFLTRDGRSVEIQRLIGRSLRAAVDLRSLGERTIHIDCDVIEADGGTRAASICGGYLALCRLLDKLREEGKTGARPTGMVAAISAGIVDGQPRLDLCYKEDSRAQADMNVVMLDGKFIEIQGTGERAAFSLQEAGRVLALAEDGIRRLYGIMQEALNA